MSIDSKNEWFIRAIADGDPILEPAAVRSLAQQLSIDLDDTSFYCIAVQAMDIQALVSDAAMPDFFANVCNQAAKNLPGFLHSYLGSKLSVVMAFSVREDRELITQRLISTVTRRLDFPVKIGVGKTYTDLMKLSYSRVDAFEALDVSFESGVFFADDLFVSRNLTARKLDGEKRRVIDLFRSGNFDEMMSCLTRLSENIRQESPVRAGMPYPTSIRRTVIELIVEILHIGADAGMDVNKILENQDPYTRIFEMHGTPKILAWFLDITKQVYSGIQEVTSRSENDMLSRAKRCIEANIRNSDLSLQMVSDELGITPGYFSAFFIREMDMGFSEYITNIRIEMAKKLLLETRKKINDIASGCGFQSASYFIFVFRKKTGLSPGAYRKQNV